MKTRLFVLVTLFMMLFTASAFADVSGGSITKLRNTSDGQKIVIFTQEGYSVASVLEFVANKPMQASNVIEAVNAYLTQPGKVRILDEHTHSADNYIQIEYTHLTEEAANRRWTVWRSTAWQHYQITQHQRRSKNCYLHPGRLLCRNRSGICCR